MLAEPVKITDDYRYTALARAVPYAYFADKAWWLPPDPDPESARIALRLFPKLQAEYPELIAAARLSAADITPIDFATPRWNELHPNGRARLDDPWGRVAAHAEPFDIVPHEFQRIDASYAIDRLNRGLGAYFGWEMGLGKTLGACMVIDGWPANFVFIACPKPARFDPWHDELGRFTPWLTRVVMGDTPKTRARALDQLTELLAAGEPTALICHYAAIKLIEGANKRGWKRFGRWDLLISDEAHLYKKRAAQFTAAARRLDAVGRLNLSGSVMSGKAEDLFVPWQMFEPKRYRSQWADWNDRFLDVVEGDFGREIVGPKLHRLADFKRELGEKLVVRTAAQHLPGVPEPHLVDRALKMHPFQAKVYHEVADELLAELPDGDVIAVEEGAPLRAGLRRVTGGVPHEDGSDGLLSVKHDAAMADMESAGDSQIVAFAWHKRTVYELQRRCQAAGVPCGLVCGDVPSKRREYEIDLFKRGGTRVLIATIATLSTAANLQNAGVVMMLEESDDPVDNAQAVARVVRQGQLVHASVFRYRVEHSVDDLAVFANAMSKAELRRLVLGVEA